MSEYCSQRSVAEVSTAIQCLVKTCSVTMNVQSDMGLYKMSQQDQEWKPLRTGAAEHGNSRDNPVIEGHNQATYSQPEVLECAVVICRSWRIIKWCHYLQLRVTLENVNSCHHILRNRCSESIVSYLRLQRSVWHHTGPHILPAWVRGCNYLITLWTC